jgi:hypothetical protein
MSKGVKLQNDNIRIINDYVIDMYQVPYKKYPNYPITPQESHDNKSF